MQVLIMYKRLKLLFMVLIAVPSIALSDQKTLLPITERERPLSLPRKSWKLDFGLELKCLKNDNFVDGVFDIQIPYKVRGLNTPRPNKLSIIKNSAPG